MEGPPDTRDLESMIEWHIQSRAHACRLSGRQFHDGETYHTLLLDTKAGFERMDLCVDAFKESAAELLAKANLVSHWKGVYEAPPPVPPDAIRKDDAESLLRKLLERHEERHAAAAYILAVMLERKRILRVKGQSRDNGRRIFIYEHPKSGDLFTIVDPDLQLNQLAAVQCDVANLLEHGLPDEALAATSGLPEPMEEPFNAPSEIPSLAPL
ncbi:MAG: hypothetical protein RIS24_2693 [Verrucomicrobiota bacterium]|jgi:hypothetical protein